MNGPDYFVENLPENEFLALVKFLTTKPESLH